MSSDYWFVWNICGIYRIIRWKWVFFCSLCVLFYCCVFKWYEDLNSVVYLFNIVILEIDNDGLKFIIYIRCDVVVDFSYCSGKKMVYVLIILGNVI